MKNTIKILIPLLISFNLFAFGDKYANSFLKTGTGVREMSLGGSVVSNADATASFYWNPALLTHAKYLSGRIMHSEEFAGVLNLDHLSVIFPNVNDYTFGIGLVRSAVDDIPLVKESSLIDIGNDGIAPGDENYTGPDADGSEGNGKFDQGERLDFGKIGQFGTSESALFISAGKNYNDKISIGLSLKTIYKDLYNTTAFGVGLDAGMLYRFNDHLKIGLTLADFTTTYLFWNDGEKEIIAPEIRLGTSYIFVPEALPISIEPMLGLNITMDGEKNNSLIGNDVANIKAVYGLEMIVKQMVALRFGQDENENFHLGAGISTSIASLNYGLSLGGSYSALGNSHQVGVVFNLHEVFSLVKNNL